MSLKALWNDLKIIGESVKEASDKTATAEHLREVKKINKELAAQQAEENSYEACVSRRINTCLDEVSALSRSLDRHKEQLAEKARQEEKKAQAAAEAPPEELSPFRMVLKNIWHDVAVMGKAIKNGWNETYLGQNVEANIIAPIRNHLREVKEINAEFAARDAAVHSFEAVTKRRIKMKLEEVTALALSLEEYREEQVAEAGDSTDAEAIPPEQALETAPEEQAVFKSTRAHSPAP